MKPLVFIALLAAGAAQAQPAVIQCPTPPDIGHEAVVSLTYVATADGLVQPTGYARRSGQGNPYGPDYSAQAMGIDDAAWRHVQHCRVTPGTKGSVTVVFTKRQPRAQ